MTAAAPRRSAAMLARPAAAAPSAAPKARAVPPAIAPAAFPPAGAPPVSLAEFGAGAPMAPGLRQEMEGRFGAGLDAVRLHDGPAAARLAEAHEARALAAGRHIAFGAGEFRPETPEGRGLLAHELAHVLQQSAAPVATAARPAAAVDRALETEAEAAVRALARGGRPALRRGAPPALLRAPKKVNAPPPVPPSAPVQPPGAAAAPANPAPQPATVAGPAQRLPPGLTVIKDTPAGIGTDELVVELPNFQLPLEKGPGPWVQKAYDDAAAGGRLVFTPLIQGNAVATWKEGGETYKSIWLGQFGFTSTAGVTRAFAAAATVPEVTAAMADPAVKKVVTGLGSGLTAAGCDIDHIVEKQIGGTSIPSNLQLLVSGKNQASGRQTYAALVDIVNQIRDPAMRGDKVKTLQLRITKAVVPAGTPDPSFVVEDLLRRGVVKGTDAVKAAAVGKPVVLSAGGQGETADIKDTGETPLDAMVKRIVPAMRLKSYKRGPGGVKSKIDTVEAELDSQAVRRSGAAKDLVLDARVPAAAPAPDAAAAGPADAAPPPATPTGEARQLSLDHKKNPAISFYYPYLSPGVFTSASLDDQGELAASGTITPSIPLLPKLNVVYEKQVLKLVAPIPAEKLVSPLPGAFRFTGGELALQLSPTLVPSGMIQFAIGPAAKPVMKGEISVKLDSGTVTAQGRLTPAEKLPGIDAAEGIVTWNSDTGWSGKIAATSSRIPKSTANVEIGFKQTGGKFDPYASGGITTQVRGATLELGARWDGQGLGYHGAVTVEKPLPLVDKVRLSGRYSDRGLWLEGDAAVVWKSFNATMKVGYSRKEEDEEGRFSGSATIVIKTEKAEGSVALNFDEQGRYWGKGSIGYQVTRNMRPVLGVELTPDRRVKVSGEVKVGDIPLTRMWPSPEGGRIDIIKGLGVKFSIPTPVPAVTAYGEIRGSLGLRYGVGPVTLKAVVFKGELYPLEDDPQVKARLTGTFAVPAFGELFGTFGAYIGLEVALGAVGAKGGIEITPSLRIEGEGGLAIEADYDKDGFSFSAEAYAKGRLLAKARVDLVADLYAAWGLFSHTWTYNVAAVQAQIGPELKLTLGRVAYAKSGDITWPSLSQIKAEPDSIDPLQVVKDMLGRGQAKET